MRVDGMGEEWMGWDGSRWNGMRVDGMGEEWMGWEQKE
jgi:hypothetical protein